MNNKRFLVCLCGTVVFGLLTLVFAGKFIEADNLKESYKKEAIKNYACSYENRNTLYEASHGAFAIREIEYTVSVDFLWTKKGDKFKNRRVKSTFMRVPVLGETSAVGDAVLSLDIKKFKKCKNFLGKEKDKDYCLIVKTGTYRDEKQLTPYVLSKWLPTRSWLPVK